MFVRLLVALAFILVCSCSKPEEAAVSQPEGESSQAIEKTITIPLEEVWSTNQNRMWGADDPVGTRYIGELENDDRVGSLLNDIGHSLHSGEFEPKAGPAFVVQGSDLEALKNAHAVIAEKKPRPTSVAAGRDISIVFFSAPTAYYTSLTNVEKQGKKILIRYELIPKLESNHPSYFSLIPLGQLSPGHYQVKIDHEPYEKRFRKFGKSGPNKSLAERVSTSFEFDIK